MNIFLGSDHAGFKLKEAVKEFLFEHNLKVVDQGNKNFESDDDYPFFAHRVAELVAQDKNARGLLFCGNAQGICMAANKVNGVRAALGYSVFGAETSRLDDNSNILCLAGRVLTAKQAKEIVTVWLETNFSNLVRHNRRLNQLTAIENKKFKSIEIIPTLLEPSFSRFERKLRKVEKFFPLAQIDVADRTLTNSQTFNDWKQIRKIKTDLIYDLHLMIVDPIVYLQKINSYNKIARVFFHVESKIDPKKLINYLHSKKARVGVSISPGTAVKKIKGLLKKIDAVMIMGVQPGINGAKFIDPYDKIKQVRRWSQDMTIVVDGGVNPGNSIKLITTGANALAVGSYLNKHKNWEIATQKLRGIK